MKLTRGEVARSLDLTASTLDRWIRQGRIPLQRSGGKFEFKASALQKWAAKRNLSFRAPETRTDGEKTSEAPLENLLPVMKRGGVFHGVQGRDAASILLSAVEHVPSVSGAETETLYQKLLEREKLTSTGVGKGIAIPHPRRPLPGVVQESAITTCFLENPVHFNAVDDKPVFVLFILLSASVKAHLHLLSRLSFCVRSGRFVDFLKTTPDPGALFAKIEEFEKEIDK
ncbi:MAG: PTS transporter subunit EIIA [Desulfobacterales bacterium]|nr:PTS transporter subunit EIIA [Desulfobacterales bacterium]